MKSKRLSVVIPGYNTQKKLWQRCVISVLNALGADDEVICVDDGSYYPVEVSWFSENGKKDGRVTVIRQDNRGLGAARNSGLKISRGKYITFVDSDDEIVVPEIFERCVKRIEKFQSDIAVYGVQTVWVEESLAKIDVPPSLLGKKLMPCDMKRLVDCKMLNYVCNKVYRKEFIDRHSITFDSEGMPFEDIIFNLECVMSNAKWSSVEEAGYCYYRTGMTLLSKYAPSNLVGAHHVDAAWKRYKKLFPESVKIFGKFGEFDDDAIVALEKRNRLKPGSPFWLSGPYNFLRKLLYHRFIRRWHLKRIFPNIYDI